MISSGTTALATSGDTAVELLPATGAGFYSKLVIINESGTAGFFSLDGGLTWARWPTSFKTLELDTPVRNQSIKFKRVASGTDVTGLYAFAV